jgi:hypothetical protein
VDQLITVAIKIKLYPEHQHRGRFQTQHTMEFQNENIKGRACYKGEKINDNREPTKSDSTLLLHSTPIARGI